jgi:hypothetical protein
MRIIKVISGTPEETERELNKLIQDGYLMEILFQCASEKQPINGGQSITILTTTISINKKVEIK